MILSDATLKRMIDSGELDVNPLVDNSIQPASIDCRLGDHFLVMEDKNMGVVRLDDEILYRDFNGPNLTLPPHSFVLATTMEYVRL
ncbi:MAG TPA: dCTP deaminase, partial [Lentisphaeria bacterium]|nr:dCTP deaminase [Lentisphaeria bacterium]